MKASSEKKRILVAGGGGFLGVNLCKNLLQEGHEVICLDNFSSGDKRNLKDLLPLGKFSVLEQDVTQPVSLHVDEIYNMACVASPIQYQADPLQTLKASTEGIAVLLNLAVAKGARLFQASTSEVYGDPHVHPQREDYVLDYARTYGIPAAVFRMSCIYGPHQFGTEDQGWVAHFLIQAMKGQPLTLYGDGRQVRDILFVDDLINAMVTAQDNMTQLSGYAFNIGGGATNSTSLLEILQRTQALTGEHCHYTFADWRLGDQKYYVTDTGLFQHLTGWTPKVSIDEGLRLLHQWVAEHLLHQTDQTSHQMVQPSHLIADQDISIFSQPANGAISNVNVNVR